MAKTDPAERELFSMKEAMNTLVRMQIAQGLAPLFLKRKRPYKNNAELSAMLDQGLLDQSSFLQKPPFLLQFYKRLLFALDRAPQRILEIGVKSGGSTALWKAVFPSATVVGVDIKLRYWIRQQPSPDGVIYLEGDQRDTQRLEEIARSYGPFDIIIDDGSHVTDDQAITMRCLVPHVRPGGFYVVEDTQASVKPAAEADQGKYGQDIWADFVLTWLQQQRYGELPASSAGTQLALDVSRYVDDLLVTRQVIALRIGRPRG
jgi:hypothetical protein